MTATARRVAAQFRSAARHSLIVRCSREGTESKEAAVSSPTNASRLSTARIVEGRRTCEYGKGRSPDCQVPRIAAHTANLLIWQDGRRRRTHARGQQSQQWRHGGKSRE